MGRVKKWALVVLAVLLCASLGVGEALADSNYIKDRLQTVYGNLDQADTDYLRGARNRIQEVLETETVTEQMQELVEDLWNDKIAPKHPEDYEGLTKDALIRIVLKYSTVTYDPSFSALKEIKADADLRIALDSLAKMAGIDDGIHALTVADAAEFAQTIDEVVDARVKSNQTLAELLLLVTRVNNDYQKVINKEETAAAKLLKGLDISLLDIYNTIVKVGEIQTPSGAKIDPHLQSIWILAEAWLGVESTSGSKRPPAYYPPLVPTPSTPGSVSAVTATIADEFLTHIFNNTKELAEQFDRTNDAIAPSTLKFVRMIEQAILEATTMTVDAKPEQEGNSLVFALDSNSLIDALAVNEEVRTELIAELAKLSRPADIERVWLIDVKHNEAEQHEEFEQYEIIVPQKAIERAQELELTHAAVKVAGTLVSIPLAGVDQDLRFIFGEASLPDSVLWDGEIRGIKKVKVVDENGDTWQSKSGNMKVGIALTGTNKTNPILTMFQFNEDGTINNVGGAYHSALGLFEANVNTLGLVAVVKNKVNFDDIEIVRAWAAHSIEQLAAKGIISGRAEGAFDPIATLTRAEFATLLVNLLGVYDENATAQFTDVAAGSWYQQYIASAVQAGLVQGRGNDMFDPQAPVTRAEMAVMASRALQQQIPFNINVNQEVQLGHYDDVDSVFAGMQTDLALAVREGIIGGTKERTMQPEGHSSRAQAAVVIERLHSILQ